MNAGRQPASARACASCLRRGRLLASVGARLEIRSRSRARLLELLALDDDELLAAIGAAPVGSEGPTAPSQAEAICCHDPCYPPSLADAGSPRLLYVRGAIGRLQALAGTRAVAICGSTRATDYGIELARTIARELAACGVTIVGGLADGVAAAAQQEAARARAGSIAVLAGSHRAGCPAPRRALAARISERGCVLAEVPEGCNGRVWGRIAAARVIARLASVTLVVEADCTPVDLAAAEIARDLGRAVAAVPGRVTSPASRGAHRLLAAGAHVIVGADDVLTLLGENPAPAAAPLEPSLAATLELVGAGEDTPEKLERRGIPMAQALLALGRLEVMGLLARGDGGRYLVRGSRPLGAFVSRGRAVDPLA